MLHIISFLFVVTDDRISITDAFQHPFLAPEIAVRYLIPGKETMNN